MFETLKKNLLLVLIGLSAFIYLPILKSGIESLQIAQYLGFVGMQLIWWQVFLGSRIFSRYFSQDLFFIKNIHKNLGRYGFILVMLHPTMMMLAYGFELILPNFNLADQFTLGKTLGQLGISLLILTWFVSVFLRTKISWRLWKKIHLVPYIALPLLFIHAFLIGSHLQTPTFFRSWIIFLILSFGLILVLRLIDFSGQLKLKYLLVSKTKVAKNVIRFDWQPTGSLIKPRPGQFAYLQAKRFGETHPFSVSHFNPQTGQISQTIKAVGPYSKFLHELNVGDKVFIEGPFGVFTKEIAEKSRPVVVIAGGIGITPFIRWLNLKQIDYLFYGSQTENDLVYQDAIKESGAKTLNVLSNQYKAGFENGYITINLIETNLPTSLDNYDFYICGPPAMMDKIIADLQAKNIPKNHIHAERFSL